MPIAGIDHIALPTADGERFLDFYKRLGFSSTDEDEWRAGR
jgi:catechol 2,3-dioxygenase-like lactoylglutathione lyase family enzyme